VCALVPVTYLATSNSYGVFAIQRAEHRYVAVGKYVGRTLPPNVVVVSQIQSGSMRLYSGRLTVRWDVGDPAWLDRMVEWLAAHGHHPYFVLEPQEIEELRARSGPTNLSARLDWTPMVSFRGGAVTLYDGVRREHGGAPATPSPSRTRHECLMQKPPPRLRDLAASGSPAAR